ncbi:MAG: hypothetical protein LBM76_02615 [Mycoplasmataceae bacterium]|nr:hypothetical protein [Mycoplasmataceae bacterium]
MNKDINKIVPSKNELKIGTGSKTKVLTFRVDTELYNWIAKTSKEYNMSPADFCRSILFLSSKKGDK